MAAIDVGQVVSVVFALLGGVLGLLAGLLSSYLAGRAVRIDRLCVLLACAGALALLVHPSMRDGFLPILATAALVGLLLLIAACDLRERAVYPVMVYPGVVLASLSAPIFGLSVVDAVAGAIVCGLIFLCFYGLARLRYGHGAFGDGDVVAAALLGAVVGFSRLPMALSLVALFGAASAVATCVYMRSLRASFAYAPTLCLAAITSSIASHY